MLRAARLLTCVSAAAGLSPSCCLQLFMYGFVEGKRWMDMRKPGSQAEKGTFFGLESQFAGTGTPGYPGGPFDPLGFAK